MARVGDELDQVTISVSGSGIDCKAWVLRHFCFVHML